MRYFDSFCTDNTTPLKSSKHGSGWLRLNEIYSIFVRVVTFAIKRDYGKRHKKAWIFTLSEVSTSKVPSQSLWSTNWVDYSQPPPRTHALPSTPGIQLGELILSVKTDFSPNNSIIAEFHDASRTKVQSQIWATVLTWQIPSAGFDQPTGWSPNSGASNRGRWRPHHYANGGQSYQTYCISC